MFKPEDNRPEQEAAIFLFLIFTFVISMMCIASTVKAQPSQDTIVQYVSQSCNVAPIPKSKQFVCTHTWYINQQEQIKKISFAVLSKLTLRITDDGEPIYIPRCRNDSYGCEARIRTIVEYIVYESSINQIDPWIVASMIWHESRFNPFVESHLRTRGVMQLHPRNRRFNRNRFLHNDNYRNQCKRILGNCQDEVIRDGIALLRSSIDRCDNDVSSALTMYNSGRCSMQGNRYTSNVLSYREEFLRIIKTF